VRGVLVDQVEIVAALDRDEGPERLADESYIFGSRRAIMMRQGLRREGSCGRGSATVVGAKVAGGLYGGGASKVRSSRSNKSASSPASRATEAIAYRR
jgi:hypothetical protein